MNLDGIQLLVRADRFAFYRHALIEADKDGVRAEDAVHVILNGEIIEEYPERQRCLIHGTMEDNLPLHVVCD